MSKILKGICQTLKTKQLRTSIYHPQTDGLVERFNCTLKGMVRDCIQGDPWKWDTMMPPRLFSIRETPQASTRYAPFELVYGHSPRGLLDLVCEEWRREVSDSAQPQAVVEFQERLKKAQEITPRNLGQCQEKQKQHYDARTTEKTTGRRPGVGIAP